MASKWAFQKDLWTAGAVGAVMATVLTIAQSYGFKVTPAVFTAIPLFSSILANYIHNVISGPPQ